MNSHFVFFVRIRQVVEQSPLDVVGLIPLLGLRVHPVWIHVFRLKQSVRHLRLVNSHPQPVSRVELELKVVLVALVLRVLSGRNCGSVGVASANFELDST